jgi:hypothetical protein
VVPGLISCEYGYAGPQLGVPSKANAAEICCRYASGDSVKAAVLITPSVGLSKEFVDKPLDEIVRVGINMGTEDKDAGEVPSVACENTEPTVDHSVPGDAWSVPSTGPNAYVLLFRFPLYTPPCDGKTAVS